MKKGQKATKKVNIHTRVGKYFLAVKSGKSKKEAYEMAGYAPSGNIQAVENTSEYKQLQSYFKDSFLQKMTMDELADSLIDNIKQNDPKTGLPGRLDRNARNGAIKIALDRLEPIGGTISDEGDKVLIVLSK